MSVLIGCIDCAEAFTKQRPDLTVEDKGLRIDGYRCPACGAVNYVRDNFRHFISREDLAANIAPEQEREFRL
jgi:hypothetical protein